MNVNDCPVAPPLRCVFLTNGGLLDKGRSRGTETLHQAAQLFKGTHHHVLTGRDVGGGALILPAAVAHHRFCVPEHTGQKQQVLSFNDSTRQLWNKRL